MTVTGLNSENFFEQGKQRLPGNVSNDATEITKPTNNRIVENFFAGNDNLSMLGQGPIKKTPAKNNKKIIETPLSEQEIKEIKELFGEKYDQIIF